MYEISRAQELWAQDRASELPTRAQQLMGPPAIRGKNQSLLGEVMNLLLSLSNC